MFSATSVKKNAKESAKQILASKIDLKREGQESTIFRFELDETGNLVPGSVHNLPRQLRRWKKA